MCYTIAPMRARAGLIAVFLCACGPSRPPLEPPSAGCLSGAPAVTGAALEVGRPDGDFGALHGGDHVQMHLGPQGGQHFYVTLRLATLEAGDRRWRVETSFVPEDMSSSGPGFPDYSMACAPGWTEIKNATTFIDTPDRRAGTLIVRAGLTTPDDLPLGSTMTATIPVLVDPPQ